MRTGRPIAPLRVTVEERTRLEEWTRRPKTAQAFAQTGADCFAMRGRERQGAPNLR
jgi:hypothetical protein